MSHLLLKVVGNPALANNSRDTDFENVMSSNHIRGRLLQELRSRTRLVWARIVARIDSSTTAMVSSKDLRAQVDELRRNFPKFLKDRAQDDENPECVGC